MSDDEQAILEFSRRTMAEIAREWGKKINFTTTLDEAAARLTIVATRVPTGEIQEVTDAQYYSREGSGPGVGSCFITVRRSTDEIQDVLERIQEAMGEQFPIGNTACTHNAESPHLRCAVNPCGPCEGCPEFEAKP